MKAIANYLALGFVVVIWGSCFPAMKFAINSCSSAVALTWRFAIAAAFSCIFAHKKIGHRNSAIFGVMLGILNFGIYVLLSKTLTFASSSRAAFLMGTSVAFVCLFQAIGRKRLPSYPECLSCVLILLGLAVFFQIDRAVLLQGDAAGLGAAAIFALSIKTVDYSMRHRGCDGRALVFYECLTTAALTFVQASANGLYEIINIPAKTFLVIVYCGIFGTAIAHILQAQCQVQVSSLMTSLIFAFEPVFATLIGVSFGESVETNSLQGGALMMLACVLLPILQQQRSRQQPRATSA